MDFGFQTQMGLEVKALEHKAQESLQTYLSQQSWDFMFTSTYKYPANYAHLAIDRTSKALLQSFRPSRGFIAAEQHQSGLWHTHGLWSVGRSREWALAGPGGEYSSRVNLAKLGFCVVGPVGNQNLASMYCAKYLTKFEGVEYEFYGKNWVAEKGIS